MKKLMMPAISVAALAAACPIHVIGGLQNDAQGEDLLKKVKAQLERITGDVKKTAENAERESKRAGEISDQTKAEADKLLKGQTELGKQVENLTKQLEGVVQSNRDLAQEFAEGLNGRGGSQVQTLGQAFAGNDERIKSFLEGGANGSFGITIKNAVTTTAGSGGGLITPQEEAGIVRMPRRRLRIRNLLGQGKTGTDRIPYRKQVLRTDGTAMVAEGAASGASDFGWDKDEALVRKIATHTNISEEVLADADLLQSEIDNELRYLLDLEEENQILAGDGTGENLPGLMTVAPLLVPHASVPNDNRIDRLRQALLRIALEDYIATSMVLSPVDWAVIDTQKDTTGQYVFGNPHAQGTPVLWGKDVVETNSMSAGEWLVGDLEMAATYYDRQETEVTISSEHGDNFIEDMLTMKAKKRAALANKRLLAMVRGNFTFA